LNPTTYEPGPRLVSEDNADSVSNNENHQARDFIKKSLNCKA